MEGFPSVNADISGGSTLPPEKREKGPEDVKQTRCNCKKSECLKMYCQCFSAATYCAEACSCDGCFNTPDYEDTVRMAYEKFRSSNPNAFKPKVLQRFVIMENMSTRPLTPIHKTGCNCKRSMCLKKYCPCYQVGAACSPQCQCENCNNPLGKTNGTDEISQPEDRNESLNKGPSGGNIAGTSLNNNMGNLQSGSHVFRSSNNSRVQQSQFPLKYPASNASLMPSYSFLLSIASIMPPYIGSESYPQAFQGRGQASVGPSHAKSLTSTIVEQLGKGTHSGKRAQHGSDNLVQQPQTPLGYYTSLLLSNSFLMPPNLGSGSYLQASQGSEQASVGPSYGNNPTSTTVQQFGEDKPAVKPKVRMMRAPQI